ncbi:hypothetical protein BFW01_g2868 [Lasiodiplodia theobromae]|uniref:Uncharacterized protein n=1 Tax=Lasiodiplodia theobromae TaxID=45133 RepID=A0A5N5DFB1_9PEZI|nr:uncharacterized protein LTHEOB_3904 [Lasiodiplodia theobromae]KAB2576488.1 hypothetical protein DBV05_g4867 [Lasiodiplodia theobromae]KAF4546596.1 hypothetical protein LTHEOB_3904 [Lasiodiplodia theobromae]KAF9632006.1 hypothetical protein BFW01_g2868 [Lasiodiplodia theobromae]
MDDGTALLLAVPYYLFVLPVSAILSVLFAVLSRLYNALQFVLLPFIYLAHFAWRAVVFPFVMLAKLETLYVYLGVAGIVGVTTGGILYFSFSVLKSAFNLDSPEEFSGATAAEYRAARRKKKAAQRNAGAPMPMDSSSQLREIPRSKRRDLLAQTILEEDDADF